MFVWGDLTTLDFVLDQEKDWRAELRQWAEPFLAALSHAAQRQWAPLYLEGLLLPGERKSVTPMAERVAPADHEQLHHFVATSPWDPAPLEAVLAQKANALVGGPGSSLQVDDTGLLKQGQCSVGVGHQYCGQVGKKANCQTLVSLSLVRGEVPIPIALRLFLPRDWAEDEARRKKCGVPETLEFRAKWRIALSEIERVMEAGVRFGLVQADAAYGMVAEFRRGLAELGLRYTVGIPKTQKVYSLAVKPLPPAEKKNGRPPKAAQWSEKSAPVEQVIAALGEGAWKRLSWRAGTKGPLEAEFIAVRVRAADGEEDGRGQHAPGEEVWLIAERRAGGEIRYYFSNLPASATLLRLARTVKGRWACEQPHQQLKEELGLDHYEGRSWLGLHHHCLMTMIAYCFLQHLRLGGEKRGSKSARRPSPACPRCGAS